jgi:hypothetical protein
MAEGNTVAILEPILLSYGLKDLVDLNGRNEPDKFPLICSEIVDRMIEALLSESERTLSKSTLEAIEDDLLKVTRSFVTLRRTPLGNRYRLKDIANMIDVARLKISSAINEFPQKKEDGQRDENVSQRIEYILQCRQILEDIGEKIEDIAAQDKLP